MVIIGCCDSEWVGRVWFIVECVVKGDYVIRCVDGEIRVFGVR